MNVDSGVGLAVVASLFVGGLTGWLNMLIWRFLLVVTMGGKKSKMEEGRNGQS